jgi:hypothetical protein
MSPASSGSKPVSGRGRLKGQLVSFFTSLFHPEYGDDMFLRNVGPSRNNTALQPRIPHSSYPLVGPENGIELCGEEKYQEALTKWNRSPSVYHLSPRDCV